MYVSIIYIYLSKFTSIEISQPAKEHSIVNSADCHLGCFLLDTFLGLRGQQERRVEIESKQVFDDGSPGDRVGSLRSPVNRGREKSVSKRRIGIGMSVCTAVSLSLCTMEECVGGCYTPL